ncbi:zinc finger protein 879-like [Bolinopsis microptera]|uniref:zinc finger protein 879-like n=1 Tax=Bolinopsis microptera TaxID=2820187 RepID=UPI003078D719
MTDKQFVYKLIVSQLHHDGYNALALLMEQMLLSSQKVQPSDWLTQLLRVCKAVSVADRELLLDKEEGTPERCGETSMADKQNETNLKKLISQSSIHTMDFPTVTRTTTNSERLEDPQDSPIQKEKLFMPGITSPLTFLPPSPCSTSFPLGTDFLCNPTSLLATKMEPNLEDKLFHKDSLQDVVKALSASRPSVSSAWPSASVLLGQSQLKQINRQHKLKNCPVCRKVLVASSLYLHMKIHSGEKNYKCEFCCKKFLLKHHLHSHLKICPNRRPKVLQGTDRPRDKSDFL